MSSTLHLVLLSGAVVFALPYVWLVSTSFKRDQEIQSAGLEFLPDTPQPRGQVPYIDAAVYGPIRKPDEVDEAAWEEWMRELVTGRIRAAVNRWKDDRTTGLNRDELDDALARCLFARLRSLVSRAQWQQATPETLPEVLDRHLTGEMVGECFGQIYRYFALGTVRLVTPDYHVYDLISDKPLDDVWYSDSGNVWLTPDREAEHRTLRIAYDMRKLGSVEVQAMLNAPVDLGDPEHGFKRLELSFHGDQTWHEMRVLVEMKGKLYRSSEPKYLGEAQWSEVIFQRPSPDDQRLAPRRYILLEKIATGTEYDHGPGRLRVLVRLHRSNQLQAWWAKCTENYRRAFDEVPFWRYFKTSVFLVAVNILGTLLSCSLAAYAFARLTWPGRDLCFVLVLATLMIPPQITLIPSFVIYKYLGWYNTLAPLWVPSCLAVNAFGIFLLRQAMKGIPRDLEEAARIDGCGYWGIYWNIILPLVKPTLAAIAIFTFLFVWNDFMGPLIYVNDQGLYPLALGLFSFMVGRENQFTLVMAGSMIMTLPVIIIFFFAQRYFIQGVAMSGMKQ
jgi:ABC-type glycerol-3-phosphate transport system permease component